MTINLNQETQNKLEAHLKQIGLNLEEWVNSMLDIDRKQWYYTYELPSGQMQFTALAISLGEAVENAQYHSEGRKIAISSHPF